mgnify:CR=1 FL=1
MTPLQNVQHFRSNAIKTERHRQGVKFLSFTRRYGTLVIFVLLVAAAAYISTDFLTLRNVMNLLRQASTTIIMAIGMLFVVLTRGIDLSIGSVLAVGGVIAALLAPEWGLPASIAIALVAGLICGLACGTLIAYLRLPPFVITLAMMTVARGSAFILTGGQPIMLNDAASGLSTFAGGYIGPVPYPVLLMAAIVLLGTFVLMFTSFGRLVKAIGSNEEAVRLSGIRTQRYIVAVYVISGFMAALAGVLITGRTGVGAPNVGVGFELQVIAAVVIGGASLMGGRGDALNTVLGALILAIIGNIMNLSNVPGYTQQVIMGAVIVAAVILQKIQNQKMG